MFIRRKNKAQSIIEYSLVFMLVAAALSLSYKYIWHAASAYLENIKDEID